MSVKWMLGLALCGTLLCGLSACGDGNSDNGQGQSQQENSGNEADKSLPDLSTFATTKSDVLPIDLTHVYSVAPYLGTSAQNPHQGMHFNFHDDGTYATQLSPDAYPAVYASADGIVSNVETSKQIGPNQGYGIGLNIAQSNGQNAMLYYSLEPFIPEPSPGFYKQFVKVTDGQKVKKGDLLGYLFVPPGMQQGTHLHFHLMTNNQMMAPAIYSNAAVAQMQAKYGDPGGLENGTPLPACIGWKVAAEENPFGTGAQDCLN